MKGLVTDILTAWVFNKGGIEYGCVRKLLHDSWVNVTKVADFALQQCEKDYRNSRWHSIKGHEEWVGVLKGLNKRLAAVWMPLSIQIL